MPCVGNGSHFRVTALMNKSNITFEVAMLSTCVFKKCSEKSARPETLFTRLVPSSDIQIPKKQKVSSTLTRNDCAEPP